MRRILSVLTLTAALAGSATATAADPPQPPLDRGVLKSLWQPGGFFKPGDPIPMPLAPPEATGPGGTYNPSGHWSAYDSNVYESLNFPGRQAGDTTDTDAPGSGWPTFGYCPPNPQYPLSGRCANHALEYLNYYEATMNEILKDFGGVVHRYKFTNPGRSDVGFVTGEPAGLSSVGGDTYNIAGVVPGSDHPEQEVIVSGHWDFTDAGHAAAWDSSEGHAEVIRIAKLMTDYWRATGTRPAVTVRFSPWAAEESGSFGSQDYATNYVADEKDALRIRGYFNMDPCAGAYPAYYHGNPADRVPMTLQLGRPDFGADVSHRFQPFNDGAARVIDEFFADVDDTVETSAGPQPIFRDADRPEIVTAVGGLALFSSDYANFEAIGVPIFNLFPDTFGPHADGTPASAEGASTIHTPRDNLTTLNALTGPDQTGMTASDGWMKGMELCANLEGRYLLQPEMGGAQTADTKPVAYMEPMPAKGTKGKLHAFDAAGSYQYASVAQRAYVDDADLQYKWDFGDGSPAAYGKAVKHVFHTAATYVVTLKLTNRKTGESDTATRRVTIAEGSGTDAEPDQSGDPGLATGSVVACQSRAGFASASVKPAGHGLAFAGSTPSDEQFAATLYRAAKGKRPTKLRKVAAFAVKDSYTWDGRLEGGTLARGVYVARLVARGHGPRPDQRAFALRYTGKRFVALKPFQRADSCGLLSYLRLSSPVFGKRVPLVVKLATTRAARVTVTLSRKGRRSARKSLKASPNRLGQVKFRSRKLKRGRYTVTVKAKAGKRKASGRLYAAKL
ncbi:MAG: carboxypeptidase [Solirubrobacteraceae bacterium]|nr:carboxypeptidase [Solirubrobacteraceae bacterium]